MWTPPPTSKVVKSRVWFKNMRYVLKPMKENIFRFYFSRWSQILLNILRKKMDFFSLRFWWKFFSMRFRRFYLNEKVFSYKKKLEKIFSTEFFWNFRIIWNILIKNYIGIGAKNIFGSTFDAFFLHSFQMILRKKYLSKKNSQKKNLFLLVRGKSTAPKPSGLVLKT